MPSSISVFSWRELPLLRLLLPFLGGIFVAWFFPVGRIFVPLGMGLVCLAALGIYLLPQRLSFRINQLVGLGIIIWMLALGYWRTMNYCQLEQATHFSQVINFHADSIYSWQAYVEDVHPTKDQLRLDVRVDAFAGLDEPAQTCTGKLLLYIPKEQLKLP